MNHLLDQLTTSVASAQTVEELTRPLLEMLEDVSGLESTYLTVIDEARGVQHILYARNTRQMQIPEGLTVPWHDTLCKRALDEGRPFTSNVAACWGDSEAARALGIQTYASTAVHARDGALYGTLCAASAAEHALTPRTERVLTLFARLIGQQVEREQLMQQLLNANAQLASTAATDPLTGLPNRRALTEALQRLLAQGRRQDMGVLIAFLDLDGFKAINDTHGHEVGDRFLVDVAQRLRAVLRAEDFVARFGGDEFVVIGPGPLVGDAVRGAEYAFGQRLARATQGVYTVPGGRIDYDGASVGVITVQPHQGTDAAEALRQADQVMYQAKLSRRRERAAEAATAETQPGVLGGMLLV